MVLVLPLHVWIKRSTWGSQRQNQYEYYYKAHAKSQPLHYFFFSLALKIYEVMVMIDESVGKTEGWWVYFYRLKEGIIIAWMDPTCRVTAICLQFVHIGVLIAKFYNLGV